VTGVETPVVNFAAGRSSLVTHHSSLSRAFTLVEVLVVMTLLSLIVIALMGVFGSTQTAFRASITQTDVLESGRAAMSLITDDLRTMTPSGGTNLGPVNFYVTTYGNPPLYQSLVASGGQRTNVQQVFFILSQGNLNGVPTWYGTGYAVMLTPSNIYSLYRFSTNLPVAQAGAPYNLFHTAFVNFYNSPDNYSHLLDGVVDFRVHAYDVNGALINYIRTNAIYTNSLPNQVKEIGYVFYSNAVPAAVEVEMATLEDRTLQRAGSRPGDLPAVFPNDSRTKYLQDQASRVHVFRQRVAIPNVDPAAYQ
jgi:type II secretory pathway component PulJ